MHAGAGPEIDDVIRAAHRLFVVLDDDERISFLAQCRQRFEQTDVVARMQSDRRFVEDVEDAAQIRAELRRQPDALRFAAAQRLGRTAEREITEPDVLHELEPLLNLRNQIGGDRFLVAAKAQLCRSTARASPAESAVKLSIVWPCSRTWRAIGFKREPWQAGHSTRFVFVDPFEFAIGREFVLQHRIAGVFRAGLLRAIPDFAESAAFLARAVR